MILFASLAINLFIGGMMLGGVISAKETIGSTVEKQDRQLRGSLSEADKLALKQAMDVHRAKITQLHDELENIKSDIRNLLRQDPMSEKTLNDLLGAQKKKELALVHLAHQTRKEATARMSPEGRVIMSKVTRLGFNLNAQCR
jgi:uncharacterized membrane protein